MLRPVPTDSNINRSSQTVRLTNQQPVNSALKKAPLGRRAFARQFARQPFMTGAIAPSSRSLARSVVRQANLTDAKTVVELGPGTGVFTEQIVDSLANQSLFFAIELNRAFVDATQTRCPTARVYHDVASKLPHYLARNNRTHADRIISSLPWTIFEQQEQDEILNAIYASLKPGGVFVSIVYLGAKFRSRGRYFINQLPEHFSSVNSTPIVWKNLPPTQIYRCRK